MKKLLAISATAVLVAPVAQAEMKMPTIYGKLNKAFMYVDQESKFNRKTNSGINDVDNSESRLGAKGSHDMGTWKANYALELGLNSSGNSGIRMRLAEVGFGTKFGTVTVGHAYTATGKMVLGWDVFGGTVAQSNNADYKDYVANSDVNVGYVYRSRKNLLKYATPKFAGFQYTVSQDKGNKQSNDPSSSSYGPTYTEHLISYDMKNDSMTLGLDAGYIHWAEAASGDQSVMMFGGSLDMNSLTFKIGYSIDKQEKDSGTTNDLETTRMIAGVAYKMNAHKVMLGYSKRDEETKPMTGAATTEEESHLSVGYKHTFNKHVSMNAIFTSLGVEQATGAANAVTDAAYKNDASIISLGTEIKF